MNLSEIVNEYPADQPQDQEELESIGSNANNSKSSHNRSTRKQNFQDNSDSITTTKKQKIYEKEQFTFEASNIYPKNWHLVHRRSKWTEDIPVIIFKTPLDKKFNEQIRNEEHLFSVEMMATSKLCAVIDLCAEENYYNVVEWEQLGIKYVHLPCECIPKSGQEIIQAPDVVLVDQFIHILKQFRLNYPRMKIGVHDTYGYNYAGYMVVCYLVETLDWSVEVALSWFSGIRPPGVYYKELIDALFKKYDEIPLKGFSYPQCPRWDSWYKQKNEPRISGNTSNTPTSKSKYNIPQPVEQKITVDHPGVSVRDPHDKKILDIASKLLKLESPFEYPDLLIFKESDQEQLERKDDYFVSWIPSGQEYLMLIINEGTFLINKQKKIYHASPFNFIGLNRTQGYILLGTMVNDLDENGKKQTQRFLMSDMLVSESKAVYLDEPFDKRLSYLDSLIIKPRRKLSNDMASKEPFRLRIRLYLPLTSIKKLVESIVPTLPHAYERFIVIEKRFAYKINGGYEVKSFKTVQELSQCYT